MKWCLINEEYIPNDISIIDDELRGKYSDTNKYTPTKKFLLYAYTKLNKRFFNNELPLATEINVGISDLDDGGTNVHFGCTNISKPRVGVIDVHDLLLNGTVMLTIHEWIEIIIHEMIHIQECIEHPEHFYKDKIEEHGDWFMKRAKDFNTYGFIIQEKFNGDFEVSVDDNKTRIKNDNEILVQYDTSRDGSPLVIKIMKSDLQLALSKLKEFGYSEAVILKARGCNQTKMVLSEPSNDEGLRSYKVYGNLMKQLEPLDEVERIDLTTTIDESNCEDNTECVKVTGVDKDGTVYMTIY